MMLNALLLLHTLQYVHAETPLATLAILSTQSCPAGYAATAHRPNGAVGTVRSVGNEQACADLCSQRDPYSNDGCLGFTTSPGVANYIGYAETNCALINGDALGYFNGDATVPCEEGSTCCTLVDARPPSQPLTPSPTRQYRQNPTASPAANPTARPTARPIIPPTSSCPEDYAATNDRPNGAVGTVRSVASEQACADLCSQHDPYSGVGCLGFTASPGVANYFGFTPTNCALINGDAQQGGYLNGDATVPCEEGSKCCTLVDDRPPVPPPSPPPTQNSYGYCPAGYADYRIRFNWGLGKITVVNNHESCAARCTQYSDARYNGGCKSYMTGMYNGQVFCRSYGGDSIATPCAPWAVPWHPGAYSGALGSVNYQTGQTNIGGNCCTRTSAAQQLPVPNL